MYLSHEKFPREIYLLVGNLISEKLILRGKDPISRFRLKVILSNLNQESIPYNGDLSSVLYRTVLLEVRRLNNHNLFILLKI